MRTAYLDTSAAFKLVVDEAESAALAAWFARDERPQLTASWLLHTELFCAAGRSQDVIPLDILGEVLARVTLVDVSRGDLISAAAQSGLRANDAIHLAVAQRLGVDEFITYDQELAQAAGRAGIEAVSPA